MFTGHQTTLGRPHYHCAKESIQLFYYLVKVKGQLLCRLIVLCDRLQMAIWEMASNPKQLSYFMSNLVLLKGKYLFKLLSVEINLTLDLCETFGAKVDSVWLCTHHPRDVFWGCLHRQWKSRKKTTLCCLCTFGPLPAICFIVEPFPRLCLHTA